MSLWADDLAYAIQMNRYFLAPLGAWPISKNGSLWANILSKFLVVANYSLIGFLLIPCALHTFLEEPDLAIRLKLIGPMSFCLMVISKYCILVFNLGTLRKCFQHIEDDWKKSVQNPKDQVIMKKNAKIGRYLTVICAAFMYGGGGFYHLIMPLSSSAIGNTMLLNETSSKPLTYPVYRAVMDVERSPIYEIVFILQTLCGFVFYTTTIGACSLAAVFVVHTCGQLEIVMSYLNEFVGEETDQKEVLNKRFRNIVERHLRALSFIVYVEQFLNLICFIEFIGCTLNICLLGYYIITEWEHSELISTVTYSILFVSFTFNIFIFCYIGELLTEQCKNVGEVSYAINWYQIQGKKPLDLVLVILIASFPAKITAGKMIDLSLVTFTNVLKTSAAYLNILRQVTG